MNNGSEVGFLFLYRNFTDEESTHLIVCASDIFTESDKEIFVSVLTSLNLFLQEHLPNLW